MGTVRRSLIAIVAIVTLACGAASVQAQRLALAYSAGDTYRYRLHITSDSTIAFGVAPQAFKLDMAASETVSVRAVDAQGVADVSVSVTNVTMKMSINGSQGSSSSTTTLPNPPMPAIELKIAKDGRVLSINGSSLSGNFMFGLGVGGSLVSAVLPDKPVKLGDTWSKDYDQANPAGTGSVHVTTASKYLRNETVKSVNAAVVETTSTARFDLTMDISGLVPKPVIGASPPAGTASAPLPNGLQGVTLKGTVSSVTTSWIDLSGHRMLKTLMNAKSDLTMSFVMAAGSSVPIGMGSFESKGSQTVDLEPA